MSTIALQRPDFSRTFRIRCRPNFQKLPFSWTVASKMQENECSKSTPARKEKELLSVELQKASSTDVHSFCSSSNVEFDRRQRTNQATFQGDGAVLGQFVAREAQTNEEYWTAAWLRAESHWEDQEHDRYVENYKRKFAQQEFNAMKKRYNAQVGENSKCIVMVKKDDRNVKLTVLKSVVGTLDLSIRYLSHGENFPGERVKPPLFCLVDRESTSRYGYISNLCVDKPARRQGIASSMLEFAVISAKAHGAEKVFVHVYRNNKSAQSLYQKLGFEVVDAATSQLSADQMYLLCLEASNFF